MREILTDKVILCNAGAITISFMDIEEILKLILLSASLLYTLVKLYKEYKDINDDK
jgi:hypothetical protein